MNDLDLFIGGLPKAELHMHLEGSIEPELMLDLARRNDVPLQWRTAGELRAAYRFTDLQSFLDLYYALLRRLSGPAARAGLLRDDPRLFAPGA